jgi:phosphoribosylglycinamide formyltransferase 1
MPSASPLRLAFLASGSGRTFQNFVDLKRGNPAEPWDNILLIASRPGIAALDRALAADIPFSILERKNFDSTQALSAAVFQLCDGYRIDLVLLAGWLQLLAIPPSHAGRVLNIHPSLLPKFGGKGMFGHHVHTAVLAAHEPESGCTVHEVDNTYDTGPILLQHRCPVLPTDTPDTLAARVFEQELLAYPTVIRDIAKKRLPQSPLLPAR